MSAVLFLKALKDGPFPASFSLFLSFFYLNVQLVDKILPILGFEPRISGVVSHCSTNWATTTAQVLFLKARPFQFSL